MEMNEFNELENAKGRHFRENPINLKTIIIGKFGIMKPVPWEKVENYLVIVKNYSGKNLIGHISELTRRFKDFDYKLKFNGMEKWIVFYNKKQE